jgi:D-glycero-alpha-D-manno-heptose-7-phosphate kinase
MFFWQGEKKMIIVRSPLRISLGGGGTDLPSYYSEHEGFLLAAAIDKYVYISISKPFKKGIFLKYSESEEVKSIKDIKHSIFREVLGLDINKYQDRIEIASHADIPSGTGLGSSGSFTTALIKSIYSFNKKHISQEQLAYLACNIEIEKLKQPIGKQDQYIASYGGITAFAFHKDHSVVCDSLDISNATLNKLEDNLLLFFTGFSRSASSILKDQNDKSKTKDLDMIKNLNYVKEIGYKSKIAIENGSLDDFGYLMHEHWQNKKNRSKGMSNSEIDLWYEDGIKAGAIGGKVVGAGGGGFLMFYTNDPEKLRASMSRHKLEEVRFKFDFEGTKLLYS